MSVVPYDARAANTRLNELASERSVHRAFGWLHLQEPRVRQWQIEATSIPAPPFQESSRAQWFLERFEEFRLASPHIDAEGNAVGELPGLVQAPVLLLSAHLDTVFPPGTDCTPREDGERLLAPGISDNGAGLAALLAVAAALQYAGVVPACRILFAANVGEEGEGDLRGMRHLFTASPYARDIGAALALEGAGQSTVIAHALGSRRLRVTILGPGGHSWADFGRPNPIVALSHVLIALTNLPLLTNPRTTLNVGHIRGGTSVNSIPACASADLDIRSVSGMQLDQVELAVLRTLESKIAVFGANPASSGLRLQVERIGERAAGDLPEWSPLMLELRAVDRHLQLATETRTGSTDANLPLSRGVPALALSAGGSGGGMHTLDEWFHPGGRTLALRRILLLVLETCRLLAEGVL